MTQISARTRSLAIPVALIAFGLIGLLAAFELSWEKFRVLETPGYVPACNLSPLVGCSKNLASWQGALFWGIPNPFIGLMAWPVVIAVGVSLLAGATFRRWYWVAFNIGSALAFAFVCWLISQSIFVLNVLCPWCLVTWSVTIPLFWMLTFTNLSVGHIPSSPRIQRLATTLRGWVVVITVVCYGVIVLLAQIHLNAIPRLFGYV